MELADSIRMNQLVRKEINVSGFVDWYETLSTEGQVALLNELFLCAQQAGGKETTFHAAVEAAGLSNETAVVCSAASFRGDYSNKLNTTLLEWLMQCESKERRVVLPVFVYYFGLAESAVYHRETEDGCNHWWHRDPLDPRVVNDLLNDPEFYLTAMRNDNTITMRAA